MHWGWSKNLRPSQPPGVELSRFRRPSATFFFNNSQTFLRTERILNIRLLTEEKCCERRSPGPHQAPHVWPGRQGQTPRASRGGLINLTRFTFHVFTFHECLFSGDGRNYTVATIPFSFDVFS